mmetsp:Transcript_37184/g.93353  ORF Transcript_37184/g.93353 Transcript_37184/m.93353 type:complete len:144 (-) Transcript_37184:1170-1601(-)
MHGDHEAHRDETRGGEVEIDHATSHQVMMHHRVDAKSWLLVRSGGTRGGEEGTVRDVDVDAVGCDCSTVGGAQSVTVVSVQEKGCARWTHCDCDCDCGCVDGVGDECRCSSCSATDCVSWTRSGFDCDSGVDCGCYYGFDCVQ